MDYDQALQYIKDCTKFGVKLGLERITEILKRLGDPQRKFPSIHIAGTNGKGSTAAMFDAVLREAAYKTGRYTSPHLSSYRERFTVNGRPISPAKLGEIAAQIKPVIESVREDGFGGPTEFEVGTALAFEFFAQSGVDIAIIEVGMGGRFDATNVIQPAFSVITHLALDHQRYLGATLNQIAFEKAGIIKPKIPVVIGIQEPGIEDYLSEIARFRGSEVKKASEIKLLENQSRIEGAWIEAGDPYWGIIQAKIGLIGSHQARNSLNVIAGTEFLARAGFNITKTNLANGLSKTVWPGRFERVPGLGPLTLYLDGAHNPDGVSALAATWQELYPHQKADLLVGILNDRPLLEMAALFSPITRRVIVTEVPDPKTASAAELGAVFTQLGVPTIIEPAPEAALQLLLKTTNPFALVSGSLYLIGLLRPVLIKDQSDV
ncbi:MAG: bifunctional folylpolyglutamate synthase/dihydrofolate synthase [Firmicutes bacterium]|nr:bifunctional folylpolyglutamate synthase/dihydrofolate synthase [Bacillota bacterium]